jgi:hypothetical protein
VGRDMAGIIDEVVAATPRVIDAVATGLPNGFPAELFECITTRLRNAAEQIARA